MLIGNIDYYTYFCFGPIQEKITFFFFNNLEWLNANEQNYMLVQWFSSAQLCRPHINPAETDTERIFCLETANQMFLPYKLQRQKLMILPFNPLHTPPYQIHFLTGCFQRCFVQL